MYKVQYRHWENRFCELKPVSSLEELKKVELSNTLQFTSIDKDKELESDVIEEVDIFNMDNNLGNEVESKYEL